MIYDIFIWILIVSGIVTVAVYSVKIARSGVRPVGTVQKLPASEMISEALVAKVAKELFREEFVTSKQWHLYNAYTKPRGKLRDMLALWEADILIKQEQEQSTLQHEEDVALEEIVAEHEQALKHFEKRIRQLEVEAVRKTQEAATAKQNQQEQPPQAEFVH
jgi:hypothetical protein